MSKLVGSLFKLVVRMHVLHEVATAFCSVLAIVEPAADKPRDLSHGMSKNIMLLHY